MILISGKSLMAVFTIILAMSSLNENFSSSRSVSSLENKYAQSIRNVFLLGFYLKLAGAAGIFWSYLLLDTICAILTLTIRFIFDGICHV